SLGTITGLKVGMDYQTVSIGKGGLDLYLEEWDGKQKDFTLEIELPDGAVNGYKVSVPPLVVGRYLDKNIKTTTSGITTDYNTKTIKGDFQGGNLTDLTFSFDVGTLDYDIRGLGKKDNHQNLHIRVPSKIDLVVSDNFGNSETLPFKVDMLAKKGVMRDGGNGYYYMHSTNDGKDTTVSSTIGTVILKPLFKSMTTVKNIVSVKASKKDFVTIGSWIGTTRTEYLGESVIENIDLRMKLDTFTQIIDLTNTVVDNFILSEDNYEKYVNVNSVIEVKDGTTLLFTKTIDDLIKNEEKISNSDVTLSYDKNAHKFKFTRKKFKVYNNSNLSILIKDKTGKIILHKVNLTLKNTNLETLSTVTFKTDEFRFIQGDTDAPYGRLRIYPISSALSATSSISKIGILDSSDVIVTDNRKNKQFLTAKVEGYTYPINSKFSGKSYITKFNGGAPVSRPFLNFTGDTGNPIGSVKPLGTISGLTVGMDYQAISVGNGGLDLYLEGWDGNQKRFSLEIELPDGAVNKYNVTVPALVVERYYDKTVTTPDVTIDYANKTVVGSFQGSNLNDLSFSFDVGTLDHDIRGLGKKDGLHNLHIRVPKKVSLLVKDSFGSSRSMPFSVEMTPITGGVINNSENNYYNLHPNTDGKTTNSHTVGRVTLKPAFKAVNANENIISVTGSISDFVVIGAFRGTTPLRTTMLNKVELKMKLDNFTQIIDLSPTVIDNFIYSDDNYEKYVNDESYIEVRDGGNVLLLNSTKISALKSSAVEIKGTGASLSYDAGVNRFKFIRNKFVPYNGSNLSLRIKSADNNTVLHDVKLNLKNINLITRSVVTFDTKKFLFIEGDSGNNDHYGRLRIYPTSYVPSATSSLSKIGILDSNDVIVTDNRKNGQFLTANVKGDTYPINSKFSGKRYFTSFNGATKVSRTFGNFASDPVSSVVSLGTITGLTVGMDYQAVSIGDGGLDLYLKGWDGKEKNFTLEIELPDGAVNNYDVTIPPLVEERYVNAEISPIVSEIIRTRTYKKDIDEYITGKFDTIKFGTKEYDLRILNGGTPGKSKLTMKIPGEITLTGKDLDGNTANFKFNTIISNVVNGTHVHQAGEHTIVPNTTGEKDQKSKMTFDLELHSSLKSTGRLNEIVSLKGNNLNLLSIGVEFPFDQWTTLIDVVDISVNYKNGSEDIDVRKIDKGDTKNGKTEFDAPLVDHIVNVLGADGTPIVSSTVGRLSTSGMEIPDSGVKVLYDGTRLIFKKTAYKDYTRDDLKIEFRTVGGLLIRSITLKLKNDFGFEILPEKGELEFGDMFPGDFRHAGNKIEFKNPGLLDISMKLNPKNVEKMFKVGSVHTANTTIPLSKIKIGTFERRGKIETFIITGDAKTSATTEVG
ncbi:MAG: hypothetical protein ACRCVS_06120, partial [Fusobacteriaceae bacterium]